MGVADAAPAWLTTRASAVLQWARKFSIFQYPFVTACCGMEYMAWMGPQYDPSRFGAEIPRFSPRQSDVLFVVGTVNHRISPVLRKVWEQMAEPKWVVTFGACASTGGFYDNYAAAQGIDRIVPVDIYIPGCPPRPEQVHDAILALQRLIEGERAGDREAKYDELPEPDYKEEGIP